MVTSANFFVILANGSEQSAESQATDLLKLCKGVQSFLELLELPDFKLNIRAGIDSGLWLLQGTGVITDICIYIHSISTLLWMVPMSPMPVAFSLTRWFQCNGIGWSLVMIH